MSSRWLRARYLVALMASQDRTTDEATDEIARELDEAFEAGRMEGVKRPKRTHGDFTVKLYCHTCGAAREVDTAQHGTGYLDWANGTGPEIRIEETGGCETCSSTELVVQCAKCGART